MPPVSRPIVLLSGPEDDGFAGEPEMKFRLTYEGELRPIQRDARDHESDPIAPHKQKIRRVFHQQLKQLWQEDRFLSETRASLRPYPTPQATAHPKQIRKWERQGTKLAELMVEREGRLSLLEAVAEQYKMFGYRFVPLVREEWFLLCSLSVLFLRRDMPGSVLHAGDIDNRIKTLIDALRPPRSQNELVGPDVAPGTDEDPFFCLLEDDKQVSHLSVETDRLLDPPTGEDADQRKARLVITVELRPYYVNMFNLSFS